MSETTIYKALDDRLYAAYPTAVIDWIGVPKKPTTDTAWLRPRMTAIRRERTGGGPKGTVHWNGLYQVSCFHPLNEGSVAATTMAAAIRDLFPQALSLTTTDGWNVNFEAPMTGPILMDPPKSPIWIMSVAIASWWSDEFPT